MRRVLIALALGIITLGTSIFCAVVFESLIDSTVALWPGLLVQRLLKTVGISITNGDVFLSTLLFWWLAAWLVLRSLITEAAVSNRATLTCPLCNHQFHLTWRRYWKAGFGRHVCPECGQRSKIRTGLLYWVLWALFFTITPFAVLSFALVVYQLVAPQYSEESVIWFLGSRWLALTLIMLWAILLPIDREIDARFRKLTVPKDDKNGI